MAALSHADRALGRLDGSIRTLPDSGMFIYMFVRREAVLSSQIEGTQSTLGDLLDAEAGVTRSASSDVDEIVNYVAAMRHGLDRVGSAPVSVRLIREMHEVLLRGVRGAKQRPGEIRATQNWIGSRGCTLDEAAFVPPPPEDVPGALNQLERFLHTESPSAPMPILVTIGLAHGQFETIHPFLAGNGRVGRLLITFLLCEREIMTEPVLYLSYFFKKRREEYYDRLQAVRDAGDWEGWLLFFLDAVATTANDSVEKARQIVDLREEHRRVAVDRFGRGAGNAIALLESLYRKPMVTVNDAAGRIGLTYAAANGLVAQFQKLGWLVERTGQRRNRRFGYQPYIDLFRED